MGTSRGKQGIQTGNVSESKQELFSRKACKNILYLALFFGCHLLAECEPQKVTNLTKSPGLTLMKPNNQSEFHNVKISLLHDTDVNYLVGKPGNSSQFNRVKRESARSKSKSKVGSSRAFGNFHEDILDAHNSYRAKHGVSPLKYNKQLARLAQDWAEHLADNGGELRHRKNSGYGENIFKTSAHKTNGREAVDSWYSEISSYPFGNAVFSKKTGHFTQVIWKDSTDLGCGAKKSSGGIIVVCNYSPPGNYPGRFYENVPSVREWTL